jgi:hypothetical protein
MYCFPFARHLKPVPTANPEVVEQLQADVQGLVAELSELSSRNDELMSAKETNSDTLTTELKNCRRKYEHAKTELRSAKGLSYHPIS